MSAKIERLKVYSDILKEMERGDDLPLPNKRRLIKVVIEYYANGDYREQLAEVGLKMRLGEDYFNNHLDDARRVLRDEGLYFEYDREQGEWKGQWKFMNKAEYLRKLTREATGIGTQITHYNERLEDGNKKWILDLPHIAEVPLLTQN
jgi:hypothetical protein